MNKSIVNTYFHSLTRTTFETPKYPRRPRDQYTAQIVNTLELSAPPPNRGLKKTNKTLQPCNQPGEVSNNKYICSSKKKVALWNSRFVKQYSDLKTSSIPLRYHSQVSTEVCCGCFVDHKYSRFGGSPSAVANRYRKSASLLKRSVSITSIS